MIHNESKEDWQQQFLNKRRDHESKEHILTRYLADLLVCDAQMQQILTMTNARKAQQRTHNNKL